MPHNGAALKGWYSLLRKSSHMMLHHRSNHIDTMIVIIYKDRTRRRLIGSRTARSAGCIRISILEVMNSICELLYPVYQHNILQSSISSLSSISKKFQLILSMCACIPTQEVLYVRQDIWRTAMDSEKFFNMPVEWKYSVQSWVKNQRNSRR